MEAGVNGIRAAIKSLRASIEKSLETEDAFPAWPAELARELDLLQRLVLVPEIMQISERSGAPIARATEVYFEVTEAFRVNRFLEARERFGAADHYENLALIRSLQQIVAARRDVVIAALNAHGKERKPLEAWLAGDRLRLNRLSSEILALSEGSEVTLPKMMVAAGLFSDLARNAVR